MITFKNGLSIGGNPKITKTNLGVRITNDLGLDIEVSNKIWKAFGYNAN
jgi:hypothetical protein